MLKIKLSPTGKTNDRHFRVVVVEAKSKLSGSPVAVLGHYHPLQKEGRLFLDKPQIDAWIAKGAVPTGTVRKLLKI